jgi:hypothetical protein
VLLSHVGLDQFNQATTKKETAPAGKDGTVAVTVSPFDGANRIRFKGSPGLRIVEFGLRIQAPAFAIHFTIVGLSAVQRISMIDFDLIDRSEPHSAIASAPPKLIWLSIRFGF